MENLSEVIEIYRLVIEDVFNDMVAEYFESCGLENSSRFIISVNSKDND